MLDLTSCVVRSSEVVSQSIKGEVFILNPRRATYFGLDDIGVHVWSLLENPRNVESIHQELIREYDVDKKVCEADLVALLKDMQQEGLILEVNRA
jgi:hypothetical protein